jgi:FAD/FMN-containing dehydrogenase
LITDFSGLRSSAADYRVAVPRSAEELAAIVRSAYQSAQPVRIRGQGHSLNGASLPAADELLVDTRDLRTLRFAQPGSVTVGAGTVLWIVQAVLRDLGFDLPVLNDGYPGPTVGGYMAAGGFGPGSGLHGGFWDNVLELTLVDGRGELRHVTPGDALYPWLFGAMGQLGVVAEARLSVIPLKNADYPQDKTGVLRRLAQQHVPLQYAPQGDERLFWFTLFVPDEEVGEAHRELRALESRHAQALRYAERYTYEIRHRGRVAPLVYPQGRNFTATGAWGWLADASEGSVARLTDFDHDFMALALSRPGWRRYVQSELARGPEVYERCFGPALYGELGQRKAELDPKGLFNRGSVFPGR